MLKNGIYLVHIASPGSRQILDQMSLFLCRKSPQAAFPQHGGHQDQTQQQNRWHFSSEDRSVCPCSVRIFSRAAGEWTFPGVFEPFAFLFLVLTRVCYCSAPKFVYRQRGNTPYIWSQDFTVCIYLQSVPRAIISPVLIITGRSNFVQAQTFSMLIINQLKSLLLSSAPFPISYSLGSGAGAGFLLVALL